MLAPRAPEHPWVVVPGGHRVSSFIDGRFLERLRPEPLWMLSSKVRGNPNLFQQNKNASRMGDVNSHASRNNEPLQVVSRCGSERRAADGTWFGHVKRKTLAAREHDLVRSFAWYFDMYIYRYIHIYIYICIDISFFYHFSSGACYERSYAAILR